MEFCVKLLSLPLWERGLKYNWRRNIQTLPEVAPLVGAWIEIAMATSLSYCAFPVAPLVGAWIEIHITPTWELPRITSLPLWERGLKLALFRPSRNQRWSLPLWERGLKY